MKWLAFVLLTAACSESGAHFTLSAPDGPSTASAFRVVLATPDQIPSIGEQRVQPGSSDTQTVPYYLQRTIADASDDSIAMVDGLRIKIEANASLTDNAYIPFVLLTDDAGTIVGIGTFHAQGQTMPSPVVVKPDEIDKYMLDVEPVTQVDDMTHAAPGQVMVVNCYDNRQNVFPSGLVWRPKVGGELRLMYPIDGSLDATGRDLDLDCDDHVVAVGDSKPDCDDTRAAFHAGAQELCDGLDTNCDNSRNSVVACPANGNVCTNATTMNGIALCSDTGTGDTGTCMSDPACACAVGTTSCARCAMAFMAGSQPGDVAPCQPGVGRLTAGCTSTTPCTVEVLAVHGGWRVEVSDLSSGSFGASVSNIATYFSVKIKRADGATEIPGPAGGGSVGQVDFMITPVGGAARLLPVEIALPDSPVLACQGSTGLFAMNCTP